jgi:hypothetical protein
VPKESRASIESTSLCGLRALDRHLQTEGSGSFVQLTLIQLEELEALLRENQLLPARAAHDFTVLHAALQQVSMWKWKARRHGVKSQRWSFAIDLPRFLISCAQEIERTIGLKSDWRVTPGARLLVKTPPMRQLHELAADLGYLDHFASYVLANMHSEPKWSQLSAQPVQAA